MAAHVHSTPTPTEGVTPVTETAYPARLSRHQRECGRARSAPPKPGLTTTGSQESRHG